MLFIFQKQTEKSGLGAAILSALCLATAAASAKEPSRTELEFFENKIRPLLAENCYSCHSQRSEKGLKGNLSVEFREALLRGGDSGPAIVPGNPDKSLLIKAVRYTDADLQMPPKGKKLSDAQIADLELWVKMGAPDPRTAGQAKSYGKTTRDHWAFKPIQKPPVPTTQHAAWCQTPVDHFISSKLEANGMKPQPLADKRTLIRRATFDLIGLPPTPEEVQAFLEDASPEAFAKVVDRLLASPHYGERWGRHWLDVARYSDTKGEVNRQRDVIFYPHAWTYRDYVIRAFNDDKPFNRFLLEQIAADKIVLRTTRWDVAALGFLTTGARFNNNNNDIINDRIDVVTRGTMGLTVTCARCHDHKFDPISQKDYYALRGIFNSTTEPPFGHLVDKPSTDPDYVDYAKKFNTVYQELTQMESVRRKTREQREREGELRREIVRLEMTHPGAPPRAMALFDSPYPRDSALFIRGEAGNPGETVPRRFLEVLAGTNQPPIRSGSGRLELASAIIHPKNPLTPRVIVNRVWQHHFGAGFVTTPDDFGNQSDPPSHPELLDYLSARFMEEGWSLKKLHRLIMLSSVYQQSSATNPRYAQADPENRLLWRANIRRLELEAVRDSLLAIGGKLDLTLGGKPVNLGATPYSTRRTVYGYVDRRNLPEIYTQFDFANPDLSTGRRHETTVPQQALFMMNSPLVVEQARNLIYRDDFLILENDEARIRFLYEVIYQREPTSTETRLGLRFIEESPEPEKIPVEARSRFAQRQRPNRPGMQAMSLVNIPDFQLKPLGAWEKYAHALLQANETIFVN